MKIICKYLNYLCLFFVIACANPGVPSGGPKDENAPKIKKVNPKNYSTNFDKSKIEIEFDEFVQLKEVQKNFIVSPPQSKNPKIRLKGKKIEIRMQDSLRENTTYVLDFGNAIVDNNEGIPLGLYRYVLTTGKTIDSLGIAGFVKNAFDLTIPKKTKVCLYDTVVEEKKIYGRIPNYIASTDSAGFYILGNLADADYELVAFDDLNSNNRLDISEPVAFIDSVINPSQIIANEKKVLDSLKFDAKTYVGSVDKELYLFSEPPQIQYLSNYDRKDRYTFEFQFNAPREDSLIIDLINIEESENLYIIERSAKQDTLIFWITDSTIYKKDTLQAALQYFRTDTNQNLALFYDTVKLNYKKKEKKKKRKKEKDEPSKKFLGMNENVGGIVEIKQNLFFEFNQPLTDFSKEKIRLVQLIDTIEVEKEFSLEADSKLLSRKFMITANWQAEKKYKIKIDSAAIHSIYGLHNNKYNESFTIRELDYYGKIFVFMNNVSENVLIQLLNANTEKVVAVKALSEDTKLVFDYLKPGTYTLKAIYDKNNNGKWDTGNFPKRKNPERVTYYSQQFDLKSNWEVELTWSLE